MAASLSASLPSQALRAPRPGCGSQRLLRCRLHPAGRCPNSSSLFPPLAAVVAVAPKGRALRPTPTLFLPPLCYPRKRGVGLVRTVIYLDVLLLVNFVVGAAFLLAAGLLCGACCSPLRLVGGAGAAAVSSLALLAPTAPWPLALTYKGMSAALCVAAAYGWQGARNTARLTAWFVLLNLTLTGALFLPGAACNNLSFYLPVSPGLLLASTAGVCGVVEGVLHVLGRSGPACFGAELSVAGRVVPLSVFRDTGFHVQEPLSGRAVVLVRLDAVSLPAGVRAYLDACLAGVGAEPRPEWGVRFVPCQTVAGHCLLPALPAALGSNGRKQDGIYAAFCDMPPPPGGWTALVSAETAALLGK